MSTIRLTMAQALTRFLAAQKTEIDGERLPIFGGVWAIFGHGNVAGLGEALWHERERLPTFRAHNEQAMAHAAIAYAKATAPPLHGRDHLDRPRRDQLVTAAALAHVNRLPVLLLPGDVFANRLPDPVLQQVEDFGDGTVSANDCFRPVSRYFDRITRPEQIIPALARAMQVLTDPAECGPVTLALCQDVQAEAYDYPESFFAERLWTPRRPRADRDELAGRRRRAEGREEAADRRRRRRALFRRQRRTRPLLGRDRHPGLRDAGRQDPPCPTTIRSTWRPIGVTGTAAANRLAAEADLVLAVGTRLQDFTTGSWALFGAARQDDHRPQRPALRRRQAPRPAAGRRCPRGPRRAGRGARRLEGAGQLDRQRQGRQGRLAQGSAIRSTAATNAALPSDAQVIGAVQRTLGSRRHPAAPPAACRASCTSSGRPARPAPTTSNTASPAWATRSPAGSASRWRGPTSEVVVMVGDGSYLMMNSEIATSVMLGLKLTIVLLDNRGFGCINRLQNATGGASFNNLLQGRPARDAAGDRLRRPCREPRRDRDQGRPRSPNWRPRWRRPRPTPRTTVVVIDTDPLISTGAGGAWWDVAVPEVSERAQVRAARANYDDAAQRRKTDCSAASRAD